MFAARIFTLIHLIHINYENYTPKVYVGNGSYDNCLH